MTAIRCSLRPGAEDINQLVPIGPVSIMIEIHADISTLDSAPGV
jgi:hypothetical protein